jgi:two-component system capsular synthesis sensor histidine kinase RcsC
MISFIGFEVDVAENGDQALNSLVESKFDLVLTDLNMPGMDGFTLACHIKEISPETPVILVTGDEHELILKKKENSSVDSILFKPVNLQDIQKIFQNMLDKY